METNTETSQAIEPEVVKAAIELARPNSPVTIEDLALLPDDEGVFVVERRHKIVETLRLASIALTSPSDWLLFKTRDNVITAFLQDSGAKRVWQLWGIEIKPKGDFVTITDDSNGEFAIQCAGDGFCRATGLFVEGILGVRYSTEDYCKDLPALQKRVRTQQASIANRDGNIIRALTGLKSVAIEEIESVYKKQGTGKTIANCSYGKGFGSRADRMGAGGQSASTPKDVPAPVCEMCKKTMKFIDGTGKKYNSFWSCPDKKKDESGKWNDHSSINDEEYRKRLMRAKNDESREPGGEG